MTVMPAFRASHRFARISATKVRPFAKMIVGMPAFEGLQQLKFTPNRGAKFLHDVLASAVANAEDQGARGADGLVISSIQVDGGPMFKRIRPKARGSANPILKRFAHINVTIGKED